MPPRSQRGCAAEHGGHLTGQKTSICMCNSQIRGNLPVSGSAGQLPIGFDDGEETVHAGVNAGQAATIRIDRQLAARSDSARSDEIAAFPFLAEAEIFEEQDRVDREGII